MKKLTKTIAMILIGTMLFSMTAFAAPYEEASVDGVELKETQTRKGEETYHFTYATSQGNLIGDLKCAFTVSWNEGYDGWVDYAGFSWENIRINGVSYTPSISGSPWENGSSYYQNYTIGSVTIRASITVDEWGDVTLNVKEV